MALAIARFQDATAVVDEAAAGVLGVNPTDLRCLGRLYGAGRLSAGELAAATGLSRGAMTAALDRLELAGHVRRVRGDRDRRVVHVEATPRARELTEAIWGPLGQEGITQLARMSKKQLRFLLEFLERGVELQERHATRVRLLAPHDEEGSATRQA